MATALVLGYLIAHYLNFPQGGSWVLMTVIVVLFDNRTIGALLMKSFFRALGTLMGALCGIATLLVFGDNFWVTLIELFVLGYVVSFAAQKAKAFIYSGMMAMVTIVLLLVVPDPSMHVAYFRVSEIFLGILIALMVSRFLYPIHAEKIFLKEQKRNRQRLASLLCHSIVESKPRMVEDEVYIIDRNIHNSLSMQRTLLIHALNGGKKYRHKFEWYKEQFELQRSIFRMLINLDSIYHRVIATEAKLLAELAFDDYIKNVVALLRENKDTIETLEQQLQQIKQKVATHIYSFSEEERLPWHAFLHYLTRLNVICHKLG